MKIRHVVSSAFLAATLLYSPVALADCWDACQSQCNADISGNASVGSCTARCAMGCANASGAGNEGGSGGQSRERFGSIAVSPTTLEYGLAYSYETQEEAQQAAIDRCADNPAKPDDCTSQVWFYNQCASLAMHRDEKASDSWWGIAYNDSRTVSEYHAMQNCKQWGEGCHIVGTFCSF